MSKVYRRTENGETTYLPLAEGKAEIERLREAYTRGEILELFAGSRGATYTNSDGLRIHLHLENAPKSEPTADAGDELSAATITPGGAASKVYERTEDEELATATDEGGTTASPAGITDWKTVIASVCTCGHGHGFAACCTDEACDCGGYRPSRIDLVFSPGAQVWGLRKGNEVTVLPLDRLRRTSRQARVAAIRSAAAL